MFIKFTILQIVANMYVLRDCFNEIINVIKPINIIEPIVYLDWVNINIFMASSSSSDLSFLTSTTDNCHNWVLFVSLVYVRHWDECQWELGLHIMTLNCLLSTHIQEKTLQVRHSQPFPDTCGSCLSTSWHLPFLMIESNLSQRCEW